MDRRTLLAFGALSTLPTWSRAQAWPGRPIRLVLPFPAGGTPDSNARKVARQLEAQLGQPFVIENKAGANGILGMDAVAKAAPDGYTFLYTTPAFAINPSVYKKLPFDARRDFVPVTNVAVSEGYLVLVGSEVPARSLKDLIAVAKQAGKQLSYASAGNGNSTHLAAEMFNQRAATGMLHVPYKGVAPALAALIGGEVQVMFVSPTAAVQHIHAGRLRALGYTGSQRWPGAKDVPAVNEVLPGYEFTGSWHGVLAPAGTPAAVVERLHVEVAKAVQQPDVRDYLLKGGYEPVASSPAAFRTELDAELRKYAELVKAANITAE
ncbi:MULTISPECIES: Bug family tripartite tricarboxylate transporter substrate binding protein [Ramlibacter]|nr:MULTISPECIES: tripartite tricarboxylate transporter substrate binding protein [Ramlibacter]MBA2965001.1 tripartite tricarboxylate transporter substrate binding protein [Ramlibacter sp. CGMCC 1.13660]